MLHASIIIPTYNSQNRIRKTIDAIKKQKTKHQYEIIIVDDGSTDNTKEEVKKTNAVYIYQENKGPASARNNGAKKAIGEILIFLDDDCIPTKNWIDEMLTPFKKKEIMGVQGAYITKQERLIPQFIQAEIEERYKHMKKYVDFIGTYSAAYRKDIFLRNEGFDETYSKANAEDTELSYRLSKTNKLIFNKNAKVEHTHPTTLTKYIKTKFTRAYWRVKLYKKYPKKAIKDSYTPQVLKAQIILSYGLLISIFFGIKPAIGFMILLLSTMIPFLMQLRNKNIILITPILLFLRSISFGAGLICGTIASIIQYRKPLKSK